MGIHTSSRVAAAAAVSLIIAGGTASPTWAQSDDSAGLEEVVVTARKQSEQLINVPLAITAFTAEAIEARGIHVLPLFTRRTLLGE